MFELNKETQLLLSSMTRRC